MPMNGNVVGRICEDDAGAEIRAKGLVIINLQGIAAQRMISPRSHRSPRRLTGGRSISRRGISSRGSGAWESFEASRMRSISAVSNPVISRSKFSSSTLGPVDLSPYIGNQTITNASASMLAKLRSSLSYLVEMARKCLIRANMFPTRCRYL